MLFSCKIFALLHSPEKLGIFLFLRSSKKLFIVIAIPPKKLCSLSKHLRSLAKVLCFPNKCVGSQNICGLLQKYCIPTRNFVFARKTFAFSSHLHIVSMKVLQENEKH